VQDDQVLAAATDIRVAMANAEEGSNQGGHRAVLAEHWGAGCEEHNSVARVAREWKMRRGEV
jgi:hypothetical protein